MAGKQAGWPGNKESGWESRKVAGNKEIGWETRRVAGKQGDWLGNKQCN
jgi:hypothetical protein